MQVMSSQPSSASEMQAASSASPFAMNGQFSFETTSDGSVGQLNTSFSSLPGFAGSPSIGPCSPAPNVFLPPAASLPPPASLSPGESPWRSSNKPGFTLQDASDVLAGM